MVCSASAMSAGVTGSARSSDSISCVEAAAEAAARCAAIPALPRLRPVVTGLLLPPPIHTVVIDSSLDFNSK